MTVPVKEMFLGATMRLLSAERVFQIANTGPNNSESNTLHSKSCDLRLDVFEIVLSFRTRSARRIYRVIILKVLAQELRRNIGGREMPYVFRGGGGRDQFWRLCFPI